MYSVSFSITIVFGLFTINIFVCILQIRIQQHHKLHRTYFIPKQNLSLWPTRVKDFSDCQCKVAASDNNNYKKALIGHAHPSNPQIKAGALMFSVWK